MPAKVELLLVGGALLAAGAVATTVFIGGDRRMLPVGRTTDAHHQLEASCETCHGNAAFADTAAAQQELNGNCRNCHEEKLDGAEDSHPRSKFRNPRMAAYWERLDARFCTSCHLEHRPEITRTGGVTVAMDFCVACHAQGDQDVRADRPSHTGLAFDTCASSGCHNFHDNRALYEEFLVDHAHEPWLAPFPVHPLSALTRGPRQPADGALTRDEAVAPVAALGDPTLLDRWAGSGHAAAGVNCAGCHVARVAAGASPAAIEQHWNDTPMSAVCADCHSRQAQSFVLGRHGMRGHPGIAKPRDPRPLLEDLGLGGLPEGLVDWLADPPLHPAVTVADARLPMRADATHRSPDCTACHGPHAVDTRHAAVEACASCHDDSHTRAYFESPHHTRWRAELAGDAPAGSGVSCATCHMTKSKRRDAVATNHNQNAGLRPNEKMIRPVCLHCHGLGFSLDALADAALIERNFAGRPAVQVDSIDWAVERTLEGSDGGCQRVAVRHIPNNATKFGENGINRNSGRHLAALLALAASLTVVAASDGIPYARVADMLYTVMAADRETYTRLVVQRLTEDERVITASEHYDDDLALPLPSQMFRFGAEKAMDETDEFSYALLSLTPINRQNGPATPLEREGLEYVENNDGASFYGQEDLGGEHYFTAVYPDYAVAEACVNCHNSHKDSPRTDFEVGDVMGGIVIRIPMH